MAKRSEDLPLSGRPLKHSDHKCNQRQSAEVKRATFVMLERSNPRFASSFAHTRHHDGASC